MRKALRNFADRQEEILKENDHKNGWHNCFDGWLWDRALLEMLELRDEIKHGKSSGSIRRECCDVANYMMMIFDNNSETK
jgi:hypothetical protein